MTMKNPIASFIPAITLLLAACGTAQPPQPPLSEAPLAGATIGGPFELTSSDGSTVKWSDFDGQYRIVYFGFAYCPDICPTDLSRTAQGLRLYAKDQPEREAQIQPIFITVDPARDTPEVVGEFIGNFSDKLVGLTGTQEQIRAAAEAFGVFYSEEENAPGGFQHSRIVYLFGPDGAPLATLPTDQGPEAVAAELAKWVR